MRICITGSCGHGAGVLAALAADPSLSLVALAPGFPGENPDRLMAAAKRCGQSPRLYADTEDMLSAETPDILIVDGPFGLHAAHTLAALRRGIAVLCDKPLATTEEQLEQLEHACRTPGALLWSMQTMRYEAPFYTAARMLHRGAIGDIRLISMQKSYRLGTRPAFYGDPDLYGGTIPWVAIHAIDTVGYFCRKYPVSVYAQQSAAGSPGGSCPEMTAACLLTLPGEVLASVTADYLRPQNAPTHGDDRVRVAGTEGILEIRNGALYCIDRRHNGLRPLPLLTPPALFSEFVAALRGSRDTLLSMQDSLDSTRIALLARRSALCGIPLPAGRPRHTATPV